MYIEFIQFLTLNFRYNYPNWYPIKDMTFELTDKAIKDSVWTSVYNPFHASVRDSIYTPIKDAIKEGYDG